MPRHRPRAAGALVVLAVLAAACSTTRAGFGGSAPPNPAPASSTDQPGYAPTRGAAPTPVSTSTVPSTTTTTIPAPTVVPNASRYVAHEPTRVFDSRDGETGARIDVQAPRVLDVPGLDAGATAVALNIVATESDGPVGMSISPVGQPVPAQVQLAGAGDTVATFVVVPVDAGGRIELSATGPAHAIVDLEGVFVAAPRGAAAGRLTTIDPTRVVDTSISLGSPGTLPADGLVEVPVAGPGRPTPATSGAVLLSVTIRNAVPPGYVVVWPTGQERPATSNLNTPAAGSASSNLVVVVPGANGTVTLQTTAEADVTVEVLGWFSGPTAPTATDGLYVPLRASTVFDGTITHLEPGYRRDIALAGTNQVPVASAATALVNIRLRDAADGSSVVVEPARTNPTQTTAAIAPPNGIAASLPTLIRVGAGDALSVRTSREATVAVDLVGYLVGSPLAADPLVAPDPPDQTGTAPRSDFDARISSFLQAHGAVGASVAVAKDGRVVYARAYGTADPSTGVPTRVDSLFRYASMSKVLTAATVLQLVQAEAVGLDDPVLPLLAARVPLPPEADPRLQTITVRQLLQHTSGFHASPDLLFNEDPKTRELFGPGGATSCEQAARWIVTQPLANDPGTHFAYVNMNFCLLGLLVEEVTREPYAAAVQHLTLQRRDVHDAVIGKSQERLPGQVNHVTPAADQPGGGYFMESLQGAGAWMGTAVDLVRFLDGMDPNKPGEHLLRESLYDLLTAPAPGQAGGIYWGLGVEVFGNRGTWGHTGSLANARGMMLHRADGLTWAIVVNGTFANHGALLRSLMDGAVDSVRDWPTYDYSSDLP